jgi:hypothetical protein
MLSYTSGRTYLLELFESEMQSDRVRIVNGPMSVRAYEQLMDIETEIRETGILYKCLLGQHDDLGISCAMLALAWAAQHPHLPNWIGSGLAPRRPRVRKGRIPVGPPLRNDRLVARAARWDFQRDRRRRKGAARHDAPAMFCSRRLPRAVCAINLGSAQPEQKPTERGADPKLPKARPRTLRSRSRQKIRRGRH